MHIIRLLFQVNKMCHALLMVLVGKLEWECIHLIVFVVPDQITKWLFCMYMYVIQNKVSEKQIW